MDRYSNFTVVEGDCYMHVKIIGMILVPVTGED